MIITITATVSPLCLFTPWNTAPVAPLPSTLQNCVFKEDCKDYDMNKTDAKDMLQIQFRSLLFHF